ncbi:hypothetical protein [Streptomyces luteogriseus]|uniref:hypothetical protein n=1 Tax=Streptomyces luteogriseus TaxID=68233 RepID=UPI00382541A3
MASLVAVPAGSRGAGDRVIGGATRAVAGLLPDRAGQLALRETYDGTLGPGSWLGR